MNDENTRHGDVIAVTSAINRARGDSLLPVPPPLDDGGKAVEALAAAIVAAQARQADDGRVAAAPEEAA